MMTRFYSRSSIWGIVLLAMLSFVLGACWQSQPKDLLGQIQARGVIRVSSDANYKPQSFLNDQSQLDGFDVDVAKEIARRLGVKVEFITPDWDKITAGNWGGQWDLSVGSMTITADREKVLYFSTPYYYTPAQFAARADLASVITKVDDFAGQFVCVPGSSTYQEYLSGTLKLEGEPILKQVTGVKPLVYPTDPECIQAIQAGHKEIEGVLTASVVIEEAIKAGAPIVKVGDPVYYEALAAAVDKSAPGSESLVAAVSKAIEEMHGDGTLTTLSMKWYGIDLTKKK